MKGTIDGIEVYLDEDQLPAFTLSVNSLTDPSKVQGVRSTTIRIIATPEARRVLGTEYMAQVQRVGARPVLRIGDGDVDLFRAEVVPVKWTRDVIECLAVGGNASWFEYANGVDLRKYNYPLGPVVNAANIIDSWTNGEIIIWPLINYNNQFDEYLDTDDIMVTELRPGVRIGLLIADLMAAGGWTVKPEGVRAKRDWGKYCLQSDTSKARVLGLPTVAPGAVLSLPDAQELVASYQSESNPPVAALMTMNVYGTAPGQMCVWGPDAPPIKVGQQVLAGSPGGNPGWLGALCRYRMPEDGFLRVSNCNFPLGLDVVPSAGEEYRLVMWDVTDGVELGFLSYVTNGAEPADSIGARYIYFTGDFPLIYLLKDHEVVFGYAQTSTSGTAEAFSAFPASSGAGTVANIRVEVDYIEGSELVIESIAPDGSLANVMKGIANAQSLLFVTDPESRMIEVWADEDYYSRSPDVTRDWTGRLDFTTAPERINPIAPRSLSLRYKDDDKDAGLAKLMRVTRNKYGNSSAPMPRGVADEQVIEIPWSASDMRRVIAINDGGTLIPQCVLPSVMNGGTEPYDITTRLLIADGVAQGQWTFDGVALSEYPRVYFLLPGSDMVPLAFGNPTLFGGLQPTVMEEQWKARLSRFRDSDALECFAHLRDNELQNFDFGMPTLVDDGSGPAWYWVQEIRDHRFGAGLPTKVTLVKIPGMEYAAPANPPVEFPEPPEPVQYRTCAYYQDFTPFPGNTSFYSDAFEVMGFTVDGTNHGDYTFDGVDQYVTVGGMDFFTGLIDALNSMAIPGFTFLPTAHLGTDTQNRTHGGWFTIKAPADAVWSFEVTAYGHPHLRYSNAGIEAWDSGTSAWVPFEYIYGDGPPKGEPRNCTLG